MRVVGKVTYSFHEARSKVNLYFCSTNFPRMRSTIILLLTLFSLGSVGQPNTARAIGSVKDESGIAIPYASVLLADPNTKAVVAGASTSDQGIFEVEAKPGRYELQVSFLSYVTYRVDVDLQPGTNKLAPIILQSTTMELDAVELVEERSRMELQLDKRVMNVGADLRSSGLNASQILEYVPSVSVDVEGNVSLRGSQNVRILINGRPSGLLGTNVQDALRQLSGDLIESVEVITNPSARYDAEGEVGIINIVLKKNQKKGVNFSVEAVGGYPANHRFSLNANYRTPKVNFFGSIGAQYANSPGGGTGLQRWDQVDTAFQFRSLRDQFRGGWSQTARAGVDFFINPYSQLTFSGLYNTEDGRNYVDLYYFDENLTGDLLGETLRDEDEIEIENTYEYNINWMRTFDEKDRKLTLDLQYIDSRDEEDGQLLQTSTDPALDSIFQHTSNTENERNALIQLDYVDPLPRGMQLELGYKSTWRWIENNFLVELREGITNDWTPLDEFNNFFTYSEGIHAGYGIFSQDAGTWSWQVGLRAEYTDIETVLKRTDERNPRSYLNWFPSFFVGRELSSDRTLQLSYSRRLSRPGFRQLLPFSTYSDNRNFWGGNPDLNPEYTHAYEMSFLDYFEGGSVLASIYYRHRTGLIQRIMLFNEDGTTTRIPVNLAVQDAYGIELTGDLKLGDAGSVSGNVNLFQANTAGTYNDLYFGAQNFSWNARLSSQWSFLKNGKGQISWTYNGREQTAQGYIKPISAIDASVGWSVLKGKGNITLSVRDLLNSRKRRWVIEEPGYFSDSEFQWRRRQWLLTFSYQLKNERQKGSRGSGENRAGSMGEG